MNSSDSLLIEPPVLVLVGPTAIGKTELSFIIAERFHCEIVSVDSMQVYRHMDIGTAKPSAEEQKRAPHHLLDMVDPDGQYDAARFAGEALEAIKQIHSRNNIPLLTGGTGLYLKALFKGLFDALPADDELRAKLWIRLREEGRESLHEELCRVDPESGRRIHIQDTQRLLRGLEIYLLSSVPWSEHLRRQQEMQPPVRFGNILQLALYREREELHGRIEQRSQLMMEMGFVEEVEKLRSMGYAPDLPSMSSIGYRHVNNYLDGLWDKNSMMEYLVRDTRRYAKRQLTWFRADSDLHWYHPADRKQLISHIDSRLAALEKKY
ncbi:MAG: tRNA (adenosine(37)-N6)-dimethylallyltransferase MiaA [Desulfobulbaceae bacterium]|nr:tRNA (adenosine(37)-N6)-dimethylallyltransferase MiaA [Desulfobulbaceae bacterium]